MLVQINTVLHSLNRDPIENTSEGEDPNTNDMKKFVLGVVVTTSQVGPIVMLIKATEDILISNFHTNLSIKDNYYPFSTKKKRVLPQKHDALDY